MVVSTIIRTDYRYREKVGGDQIIIQGFTVLACCADDRRRQITFNMNVRRGCLRSICAFSMNTFSMRDTSPVQRVIKTGNRKPFSGACRSTEISLWCEGAGLARNPKWGKGIQYYVQSQQILPTLGATIPCLFSTTDKHRAQVKPSKQLPTSFSTAVH